MIAFGNIAPCSLVEVDLMMKAVRASETLVYFKETTWRYIPERCHLHTRLRENLKSHMKEETTWDNGHRRVDNIKMDLKATDSVWIRFIWLE
jgi:hypothetical protein